MLQSFSVLLFGAGTVGMLLFGGAVSAKPSFDLRLDWTNLPPQSSLAKAMTVLQTSTHRDCDDGKTFRYFSPRNSGLGSDLHTYALDLCRALEENKVSFHGPHWTWADDAKHCSEDNMTTRPLLCYFGTHLSGAAACPASSGQDILSLDTGSAQDFEECPTYIREDFPVGKYMAAAMEYIFQSVRPVVIQEAVRQAKESFPEGLPDPNDLITVHIRWGDKGHEVPLLPVEHYVRGAQELVTNQRKQRSSAFQNIHIYLVSKDADAILAFQKAAPSRWKIHTEQPSGAKIMTNYVHGLKALGVVLVSLQANHFVLGTVSNWSRLINELRLAIVDPRCNSCTNMLDLHYGEWPTFREGKWSFFSDFGRPTYSQSDLSMLADPELPMDSMPSLSNVVTLIIVITTLGVVALFSFRRWSFSLPLLRNKKKYKWEEND